MALLCKWLLVMEFVAIGHGNVVVEAKEGLIESDPGNEMCVTTVTSTTMSASLLQASTARMRLREGVQEPQARSKEQLAEDNSSQAAGSHVQSGEVLIKEASSPCLLQSTVTAATSLLQQGRSLGLSAIDRLHGSPSLSLRQGVIASTGALILICCLLAVLGASAFLAMISLANTTEPHLPAELLARANSPQGSRLYLPMTASPPPSLRSARSPEVSMKAPLRSGSEVEKFSTTSRVPLAKTQDLASSDEEKPPRRTSASELHFCPDLVVPQHCECILVLPVDVGTTRTAFTIMDVHGSPVLKAVPGSQPDGTWLATVTTSAGEKLVTCFDARPSSREVEYHLNRASGQSFAKLTYNQAQDKYLMTLQSGTTLSIWGNFANSAVNITDAGNRLLATTEIGSADFDPDGTYCRLRVAPLADVGLALCGLLCIGQHLQRKK